MKFHDLHSAFHYIESFTNFEKMTPQSVRDFKQDRMFKLLDFFGHPEEKMELFHIAGSKGKGSTAIFLASILSEEGHTTGLYTSPHVMSYKERITRAGTYFHDSVYLSCIEAIADMLEVGYGHDLAGDDQDPTTFELLTLLAFLVFRETGCTHGVIETGIGGRLDATNVIVPRASILTPVELEHTDILGETIEQIAFEKGGIIKNGVPAFSGLQSDPVTSIFTKCARKNNTPLIFLSDRADSVQAKTDVSGNTLSIQWTGGDTTEAPLAMLGDFQRENAALAAMTVRELSLASPDAVTDGLSKAVLPGRMELLERDPVVVLDGAHTPSSLDRLCINFIEAFPIPGVCIYGNVTGKRIKEMAGIVSRYFRHIIVSTPGTFKKSDPAQVYSTLYQYHRSVFFKPDPEEAFSTARKLAGNQLPILVTGSFYMIGEIKRLYR